jgi:hypothetical protein
MPLARFHYSSERPYIATVYSPWDGTVRYLDAATPAERTALRERYLANGWDRGPAWKE